MRITQQIPHLGIHLFRALSTHESVSVGKHFVFQMYLFLFYVYKRLLVCMYAIT